MYRCRSIRLNLAIALGVCAITNAHQAHSATITAVRLQPHGKAVPRLASDPGILLEVSVDGADAKTRIYAHHAAMPQLLDAAADADGKTYRLTLPLEMLMEILDGHGRSLWLAAGEPGADGQPPTNLSPKFRFDLPGVNLNAQTRVSRRQGVQIIQQALNLMPGYRVLCSEYRGDGTPGVPRVIAEGGEPPSLVPAIATSDPSQLTIQWKTAGPAATTGNKTAAAPHADGTRSWLLWVENVDGSRSRTLMLGWNGAKFTDIREFQEAIPAPTDELVTVPDVTGMPLDRAAVLLAGAGLSAMPVMPQSLGPLPTTLFTPAWLRTRVVEGQGLAPGEDAHQGSVVFLSVRGDEAEILAQARRSWIGPAPTGRLAGQVDRPGAPNKSGGLEDRSTVDLLAGQVPFTDQSVPELEPMDPQGGLSGTTDKGAAKPVPGGLEDNTGAPTIPINPQEVTNAFHGEGATDTKEPDGGLEGMTEKGDPIKRPGGLVDNSKTEIIPQPKIDIRPEQGMREDPIVPSPSPPPVANQPPGDDPPILLKLVRVPDMIGMSPAEAASALQVISIEPSYEGKASPTDVIVAQDPQPGYQPAPENVQLRCEVPVPNITNRRVPWALARLQQCDLRGNVEPAGHETHGCIGQAPAPHTKQKPSTLPHGGVVQLTLGALVPDLLNKTVTDAQAILSRESLEGKFAQDWRAEDIVVAQQPSPRSVVSLQSTVQLQLGRAVPRVEQMTLSKARQTLVAANFVPRAPTAGNDTATVLYQDPRSGVIAPLSSEVRLDLRITVPDVVGLPLAEAQNRVADAGFVSKVPNGLADPADIVRGQNPAGGTANATLGSAIELSPVVAVVPDVVGMTVTEATNELHDRQRFVVDRDERLTPEDQITAQTPRAGAELERGSSVRIRATVQVPNVVGEFPEQGTQAIAAAKLESKMEVKWVDGDRIVRQEPNAGRRVRPHTAVELWFGLEAPNLLNRSEAEARQTLEYLKILGRIARTIQEETMDESKRDVAVVFAQKPRPGRPIIRTAGQGAVMELTMKNYVYVPPVTVGAYIGLDLPTADRLLRQDQLNGVVTFTRTELTQNPRIAGRKTIEWQRPLAGERVPPGSRVELRCVFFQYQAPVDFHQGQGSQFAIPVHPGHGGGGGHGGLGGHGQGGGGGGFF